MYRAVVVLVGLSIAALLPVAAGAHHKPGHTGGPGGGGPLSLSAAPNPIVFGGTTLLSGRLTGRNNSGQTVTLRGDSYPFGPFNNVTTAVTNAQGRFAFRRGPKVNTRYQVRRGNDESGVVSVLVRIRVSFRANDSTPRRGSVVRFTGRACPTHNGSIVAIQRRGRDRRYRTVRRTRLVASTRCSVYSRRLRIFRDGRFRAVVATHVDHARGISRSRVIDVHR